MTARIRTIRDRHATAIREAATRETRRETRNRHGFERVIAF
jgi:hypothetical protein